MQRQIIQIPETGVGAHRREPGLDPGPCRFHPV